MLTLEGAGKSSAKIENIRSGETITITVNTISKEVSVVVGTHSVYGD